VGAARPAWRAAEEFGLDMSLTIAALELPVWERIEQHRAALDLALKLQNAFKQRYGKPGEAP
jgi:hypothetical protein